MGLLQCCSLFPGVGERAHDFNALDVYSESHSRVCVLF